MNPMRDTDTHRERERERERENPNEERVRMRGNRIRTQEPVSILWGILRRGDSPVSFPCFTLKHFFEIIVSYIFQV